MASNAFPVNFAGNIYDIRQFVRDHPGGVRTLEKYRGKSIVHAMKVFGHSYSAYHMLNDFKVSDSNLTGTLSENGRIITKENADLDEKEIVFLEELELPPRHPSVMASNAFPVNFAGNIYDIRQFVRDHPGGVRTLEKYRGKSIVHAMKVFGHSYSAYHMLNDFKVSDSNLTGTLSENGRIITKENADLDEKEIIFLEELESRLDWSKPILAQLHKIAPHYEKWVNSAVYRKCRLFESPVLESLTFTPWYLVPMFWIPIIIYMCVTQFMEHVLCGDTCRGIPITKIEFLFHIIIGFIVWTFLEYSLHRWVFHYDPGSSITMIQLHFLIHGMHHKVPFDGLRQVFPPAPALVIALVLFVPVWCILSFPLIKMVGGITGYLIYDMIHYYVHHGSPRDGSYLYEMKRYHSNHHFLNHDKAFGISSKIWDHVFKTFVKVKKLGFGLHW